MAAKSHFVYFIAKSIFYYICHRTDAVKCNDSSVKQKKLIFDHQRAVILKEGSLTLTLKWPWHLITPTNILYYLNTNYIRYNVQCVHQVDPIHIQIILLEALTKHLGGP